jgi:hypothetical protein
MPLEGEPCQQVVVGKVGVDEIETGCQSTDTRDGGTHLANGPFFDQYWVAPRESKQPLLQVVPWPVGELAVHPGTPQRVHELQGGRGRARPAVCSDELKDPHAAILADRSQLRADSQQQPPWWSVRGGRGAVSWAVEYWKAVGVRGSGEKTRGNG